ncbi:glycoside hydrolase family 16 protein [Hephaestia mangrovi]|uniref:glycoside hydrolase family 16 protein n=1 Tax=Hephaestia mangrovi TaxID=2873268 RepID=UPI001CA6A615|nr:glycoside hydrolase family 16 protein [Hephaestia mangrovi]MBY8829735.1 glycoside hydrolase family 16 protein [Hephaestia mangrovi]
MTIATAIAAAGLLGFAVATLPTDASQGQPVSGPPAGLAVSKSFDEEFDGSTLDPARWAFALYDPHKDKPTIAKRSLWNNGELEVYTDRSFLDLGLDPFDMANGVLTISAKPLPEAARTRIMGAIDEQPPAIRDSKLRRVEYSSGLISTRASFSQTYGYFEMRAKWSRGKGLWPAFWLLPASGGWPPEIDIMEAHGDKPRQIFQSVHSKSINSITKTVRMIDPAQQYHTYGLLWTPENVDYYIDGEKTASIPTPADMHQPMYLVANLAVGGGWPGDPDAATQFPATMQIDYIRAWKLSGDQ